MSTKKFETIYFSKRRLTPPDWKKIKREKTRF